VVVPVIFKIYPAHLDDIASAFRWGIPLPDRAGRRAFRFPRQKTRSRRVRLKFRPGRQAFTGRTGFAHVYRETITLFCGGRDWICPPAVAIDSLALHYSTLFARIRSHCIRRRKRIKNHILTAGEVYRSQAPGRYHDCTTIVPWNRPYSGPHVLLHGHRRGLSCRMHRRGRSRPRPVSASCCPGADRLPCIRRTHSPGRRMR